MFDVSGHGADAGTSLFDYSVSVFDDDVFDVSGHGADGRRVAARLLGGRV